MANSIPLSVTNSLVHDSFGMITVGRSWEVGSEYRYGFNGQENTEASHESDNYLDYGARFFDPRFARFFSPDPKQFYYPSYSPYSFAFNSPLAFIDLLGESPSDVIKQLNKTVIILDPEIDKIKERSDEKGAEYSAMISRISYLERDPKTKTYKTIHKVFFTGKHTDKSPNHVGYIENDNYIAIGQFHTHTDDNMPHSAGDLLALKKHSGKIGFISIIDAGSTRFALVIEDPVKAKQFYKDNYDLEKKINIQFLKMRSETELTDEEIRIKIINDLLEGSGIGFYQTNDEKKVNFVEVK